MKATFFSVFGIPTYSASLCSLSAGVQFIQDSVLRAVEPQDERDFLTGAGTLGFIVRLIPL